MTSTKEQAQAALDSLYHLENHRSLTKAEELIRDRTYTKVCAALEAMAGDAKTLDKIQFLACKALEEMSLAYSPQETQACGYGHLTLIRDLANGKKASLTDIEITLTNIAFVLSEPMRDGDVAKAREWTIDAMSKIKEMKDD